MACARQIRKGTRPPALYCAKLYSSSINSVLLLILLYVLLLFSYNVQILSQISKAVMMFARVSNLSAGGIL